VSVSGEVVCGVWRQCALHGAVSEENGVDVKVQKRSLSEAHMHTVCSV
jgi:hypothetical protein